MTAAGDFDAELDRVIADWLARREDDPRLLPGEFAAALPPALRSAFLQELEALADLDRLTTGSAPRDLPLRFHDFRVLGEIGRGAMGAVYVAEQVSLGRRIALKVMHAHVAADLRSAARFQREARTAASLVHPGIVPVHGSGQHDGFTWLAMGLIEGRSLQRLLHAWRDARDVDHARARRLFDDPAAVARALADAADALEFAHRKNVVHRDVKPANLMLGDDGRVVVLDFGLATAREDDASTLTRTGDFLGTPLYMAPEQAVAAANGTARSDVYALGAVLYECLCGRPPVEPGPLPAVLDAILREHPVDPRRVQPGASADLARIAMQCLEKAPERRYATAAELADDLRRFVDGGPVRARGAGPLRRLLRQVRRRPLRWTAAAALAVVLPVAVFALVRDQRAAVLELAADQGRVRALLAASPEGMTAFGGASQRFYQHIGLGEQLPAAPAARSANAAAALQIVERLAQQHPDDLEVRRLYARTWLDLGDDPPRADAALAALLALPASGPADRWMVAVWQQVSGRSAAPPAPATAPAAWFWQALWHQHRQDYVAAIDAFDHALAAPDLDDELRYYAYLHRGWCATCPEVSRLRQAEDDLLQAATLRPNYGTARLLWAALRCLDPTDDLSRPVAAVGQVLTAANMEPWLVVLTARVLVALAEGGTWQAGPLRFCAEWSPIAPLPLPPGRGQALAGKALELLDAVLQRQPDAFEPRWHRAAALAVLGRHAEAVRTCTDLASHCAPAKVPLAWLQLARVELAAGHGEAAFAAVDRALGADQELVAAWRLRADIAAFLGDLDAELAALARAAALLARGTPMASVLPDAAPMLPELQLRRARGLLAAGRVDEADEVLQRADFGGALAGEAAPRVVTQRDALRSEVRRRRGIADAVARAAVPAGEGAAAPAAQAAALARGWTQQVSTPVAVWAPGLLDAGLARADGATAAGLAAADALRTRAVRADAAVFSPAALLAALGRGDEVQDAALPLPITALLPHVPALVQQPAQGARLLAFAAACVARDPDSDAARMLHATVLYFLGRAADVVAALDASLPNHPHDLRARYLLAAAAVAVGKPAVAARALQCERGAMDEAATAAARAAALAPFPTTAAELIAALR